MATLPSLQSHTSTAVTSLLEALHVLRTIIHDVIFAVVSLHEIQSARRLYSTTVVGIHVLVTQYTVQSVACEVSAPNKLQVTNEQLNFETVFKNYS